LLPPCRYVGGRIPQFIAAHQGVRRNASRRQHVNDGSSPPLRGDVDHGVAIVLRAQELRRRHAQRQQHPHHLDVAVSCRHMARMAFAGPPAQQRLRRDPAGGQQGECLHVVIGGGLVHHAVALRADDDGEQSLDAPALDHGTDDQAVQRRLRLGVQLTLHHKR
jgi:hypothetical protein